MLKGESVRDAVGKELGTAPKARCQGRVWLHLALILSLVAAGRHPLAGRSDYAGATLTRSFLVSHPDS